MKIQQKWRNVEKCRSDEEPEGRKEMVHKDDGETRKDKRRRFGRCTLTWKNWKKSMNLLYLAKNHIQIHPYTKLRTVSFLTLSLKILFLLLMIFIELLKKEFEIVPNILYLIFCHMISCYLHIELLYLPYLLFSRIGWKLLKISGGKKLWQRKWELCWKMKHGSSLLFLLERE